MEAFTTHTGVGVPLRRSNVDTDQIIPAVYLKRVTRTGFEDGLFAAWRNDPGFVLNQPEYAAGTVLVAGPDFGTGSSREHAVWALHGLRLPGRASRSRFGDIFRGNSGKAGLLAAQVDEKVVQRLWDLLDDRARQRRSPSTSSRATVKAGDGSTRSRTPSTSTTTRAGACSRVSTTSGSRCGNETAIEAFEATRPSLKPKTIHA